MKQLTPHQFQTLKKYSLSVCGS